MTSFENGSWSYAHRRKTWCAVRVLWPWTPRLIFTWFVLLFGPSVARAGADDASPDQLCGNRRRRYGSQLREHRDSKGRIQDAVRRPICGNSYDYQA